MSVWQNDFCVRLQDWTNIYMARFCRISANEELRLLQKKKRKTTKKKTKHAVN
jgi:hypothetical protein